MPDFGIRIFQHVQFCEAREIFRSSAVNYHKMLYDFFCLRAATSIDLNCKFQIQTQEHLHHTTKKNKNKKKKKHRKRKY